MHRRDTVPAEPGGGPTDRRDPHDVPPTALRTGAGSVLTPNTSSPTKRCRLARAVVAVGCAGTSRSWAVGHTAVVGSSQESASGPSPFSYRIRRASSSDAAALEAVFNAAVRDGWRFLGSLADEPMFAAAAWPQLIAEHAPPNALLVAVGDDGRVLGYCAVHPDDGEMHQLFVDPEWAGRGIGRTLLAAGHDALRDAGCTEAFLFTHEQNNRALAVYQAAGYRPDGYVRESEFQGLRLREVRLVAPLDSIDTRAPATRRAALSHLSLWERAKFRLDGQYVSARARLHARYGLRMPPGTTSYGPPPYQSRQRRAGSGFE